MVRNYVRKTQKGAGLAYSSEDLEKAVNDVKNGNKTTRGAAMFYGIPRSTVQHYVSGTRGKGHISQGPSSGGGGVTSYLSAADEEELANAIKVMEKNGFGLTGEEVLDIVQCYIVENKLETRFKNQRPGPDWFFSFRKRHRLSIKLPQSIEHSRCDQTNPWVIYDFFEKITDLVEELGLKGKPWQIYNCDETSFCHDPSKTRVVGAVNEKSQRKTSTSGRENTTTLLCVSADGRMLPLLCVFKGKYVMENWVDNDMTTQTAVSASERGWMETRLFYNWFRDVFLTHIGTERPVILLYDGHTTHISTKLIQLAQENEVTIVKLPPHTTHVLQPLDVAVFKGLKQKWDKELCKWQRQNPRKKIPKKDFMSLLTKVSKEVSSMSIINGFRTTGIYDPEPNIQGPNKKAISESVFNPIDLQKYKKELALKSAERTVEAAASTEEPEQLLIVEVLSTADLEVPPTEEPQLSYEHEQPLAADTDKLMEVDAVEQLPTPELQQPSTSKRKTFEELLLDICKSNSATSEKPKKRKKIVHTCEIITTEKYLQMKINEEEEKERAVLEKEEKRKKREEIARQKKEKKVKAIRKAPRVVDEFSSDENSDTFSVQDSDKEYHESFSEYEDEDERTLKPGAFCIAKVFGKTKHSFRLYVAKVKEQEKGGYIVLFFKRHNQTMKFKETDEESFIRDSDVVRHLRQPISASCARYSNMIGFAEDLSDLTNLN